jgi:hypothetical protein
VDAASERETLRRRPALSLSVPLFLALAVWNASLWQDVPAGPQPELLARP